MNRTLSEWLGYIEELHDRQWDLGLERVGIVAEQLNVQQPGRQTILIAGTNGKGSTCEYLEHLALKQGLSTGKSTSPHLQNFNERIVINGHQATDNDICRAFSLIEKTRGPVSLSYFEFSTLAALVLFKEFGVDLAILEIGLGGRLDAMNIVSPDACVITKIALDHQAWLGDSVELIGQEKAGIMRTGIPCILASIESPASVLNIARDLAVPVLQNAQAFGQEDSGFFFSNGDERVHFTGLPNGNLARESFMAAVQTMFCLGHPPTKAALIEVLAETRLLGRFQIEQFTQADAASTELSQLVGARTLIFDVAHNIDAVERLTMNLQQAFPDRACRAVFGVYKDKDYREMLKVVLPAIDSWYLTSVDEDRAESPAKISSVLVELGASGVTTYDKVSEACKAALEGIGEDLSDDRNSDGVVLIFGNFPLVADALRYFKVGAT